MATNEHFRDGDFVSLPVPASTASGAPVRIGSLNGVTATKRANSSVPPRNDDGSINSAYEFGGGNPDGYASVWLRGAHDFTVAFAVAAEGTPIYIDSSNALSATATDNSLFGHALSTKAAASGPLTVRIAN